MRLFLVVTLTLLFSLLSTTTQAAPFDRVYSMDTARQHHIQCSSLGR